MSITLGQFSCFGLISLPNLHMSFKVWGNRQLQQVQPLNSVWYIILKTDKCVSISKTTSDWASLGLFSICIWCFSLYVKNKKHNPTLTHTHIITSPSQGCFPDKHLMTHIRRYVTHKHICSCTHPLTCSHTHTRAGAYGSLAYIPQG